MCIARFLPKFRPEYVVVNLDDGWDAEQAKPKVRVSGKLLDFSSWLMAWDAYRIACAVTGQLPFSDACQHKLIVQQIAMEAQAEQRHAPLAVLYDQHMR